MKLNTKKRKKARRNFEQLSGKQDIATWLISAKPWACSDLLPLQERIQACLKKRRTTFNPFIEAYTPVQLDKAQDV